MRRWTMIVGLCLGSHAVSAEPHGYRGDGTGVFAPPPSSPGTVKTRWSTPTPSWSNAGATVAGDLVCTTAEPTTLLCLDRRTGAPAWSATNGYAETLTGEAREAHEAEVAEAPALEAEIAERMKAFSRLRREVRADPSRLGELESTQQAISTLRAQISALEPLRTPPTKEIIGYASATPVYDGTRLYALFAQGVVSAFTPKGERLWSVWAGPAPGSMNGYHMGASASPVLIDGVLVVPHATLQGRDPATGALLWEEAPYRDFGTPAPLTVDGVGYVVCPDGRVVRARDGKRMLEGLGHVYFTSPLVHGQEVYMVGGQATEFLRIQGFMPAKAWRIEADGEGLKAIARWDTEMPVLETLYSAPVHHGDRVWFMDRSTALHALDVDDGRWRRIASYEVSDIGQVYAPLTVTGEVAWILGEGSTLAQIDLAAPKAPLAEFKASAGRAGVHWDDEGVGYVRTLDGILAIEVTR